MKDGYEIGYGKPPRHTQFQRGQSGNPHGRQKGARNFKTYVQATLHAPVKLTREGQERRISTQEALLLRLREKALNGDGRALDRLLQLAQQYNNDELVASTALSTNDEKVLDVYRHRILSGLISSAKNDRLQIESGTRPKSAHIPKRPSVGMSGKQSKLCGDGKPSVRRRTQKRDRPSNEGK